MTLSKVFVQNATYLGYLSEHDQNIFFLITRMKENKSCKKHFSCTFNDEKQHKQRGSFNIEQKQLVSTASDIKSGSH